MHRYLSIVFLALALSSCHPEEGTLLPAIAPRTDYGKGVSAAAAGEIDGVLVIAGGANFPDIPAAEGGTKRFYDDIFILDDDADGWLRAGTLPSPSAYGAVYARKERLIIAGGADTRGSLSDVIEISMAESHCGGECCDGLDGRFVIVTPLTPLPTAVEQAAAAQSGDTLYLAGGLSDGVPSTGVYRCDLASESCRWEKIAELPEPSVQPIAAVYGDKFYLWGGFNPLTKQAADYGYCYNLHNGEWSRTEGMPDGGTAAGSTAVQAADGTLTIAGGVNRDIFNRALNLAPEETPRYLSHPAEWYRFRDRIMTFDPASGRWRTSKSVRGAARAGAAVVLSEKRGLVILNGEEKPGIRSSENRAFDTF